MWESRICAAGVYPPSSATDATMAARLFGCGFISRCPNCRPQAVTKACLSCIQASQSYAKLETQDPVYRAAHGRPPGDQAVNEYDDPGECRPRFVSLWHML